MAEQKQLRGALVLLPLAANAAAEASRLWQDVVKDRLTNWVLMGVAKGKSGG